MVRVAGGEIESLGKMPDFFLDRLEVTNRQYKAFVDAGGYRDRARWPQAFQDEGKEVPWEEGMRRLVDGTGRPGPSTWQAGDFPKGQADYPVGGISWYEAAAYCAFAGKRLPTRHHWEQALGATGERMSGFAPLLAKLSNFGGEGPAPAGSHHGMTAFGALNMAGNVREWCWNPTKGGRLIRGGAWDDAEYMGAALTQQSPWNRAAQNGVRCVVDPEPALVPEAAFTPTTLVSGRDYRKAMPAGDAVFASYRSRFDYDPSDLGAKVEARDEGAEDWIREKVTLNAAYGGERVIAHLLLPRNATPPFQVVVYFPGTGVFGAPSDAAFPAMRVSLDFFVKSGRLAVYPIYTGAHERSREIDYTDDWKPYQYSEWPVKWVKDFRRVLDYLETRPDVDRARIALYGYSQGGVLGGIIPAVDDRVRLNLLVLGGFGGDDRPEVNPLNFLPRVRIPTLLLGGKLDPVFPLETDAIPFFRLLGTPAEHKRHVLYDTDHYVPKKEIIKECLDFLDRYFGPPGTVASNPIPASAPSR
jgi:dienelactone hydrolase